MGATMSYCERGVKVVFLDGEIVEVFGQKSFSRVLVMAAYQRLQAGAWTRRELTVDPEATKAANKNSRKVGLKSPHVVSSSNALLGAGVKYPRGVASRNDLLGAEVTRRGALDMQVCVPEGATDEAIIQFANSVNPCGTTYGWQIRRDGDEALDGDPERQPCAQRDGFVHVVLDA